nr:DUF2524 domain-containing protein [Longirhabdus pacifica]
MINNLESNYNCAHANDDLPQLKQELMILKHHHDGSEESKEKINTIENQIHFIENKCHM